MKIKKEYFILCIVIVALAAYITFEQKGQLNYELPQFEECKKDDISKMVIEQGNSTIHIVKKDENWLIEPHNYTADASKVDEMIKSCSKLKLTSMVSESKNYALYDLDSENRIRVTAFKGSEVVRQFDIGKATPSYNHTFIKLLDDDRVFHASNDMRQQFKNAVSEARDKSVLKFDKNEIKKVRLFDGKKSMALVKSFLPVSDNTHGEKQTEKKAAVVRSVWKTENGENVKPTAIESLVQTLSNLSCEDYTGDELKKDSGKLSYRVMLNGTKNYTISIFEKSEDNYNAASSESKYPFSLSEYIAKKIMVSFDDLKKK